MVIKKAAKSPKKVTSSAKKSPKFLNLITQEEREICLDSSVMNTLENELKKVNKKGADIGINDLLANVIIAKANTLKFKSQKSDQKKVKFNLPVGLWSSLEEAAARNKTSIEEVLKELTKAL